MSAGAEHPPDPDAACSSADPRVVRERGVRDVVATLAAALGGLGATYLRHVKAWAAELDRDAVKLASFPQGLMRAADRLPASPPSLRAARDAFTKAVALLRGNTRVVPVAQPVRRVSRADALSAEVRRAARYGRYPPGRARVLRSPAATRDPPAPRPLVTRRSPRARVSRTAAWQCFAAPVPGCPAGAAELLGALRDWVRAEGNSVQLAAGAGDGRGPAAAYAKVLAGWAKGVGRAKWPIPRVSAGMRGAARAVSDDAERRLDLAIKLYRREYASETAGPRLAKPTKGMRRETTDQREAQAACAVRAPVCSELVLAAGVASRRAWRHAPLRAVRVRPTVPRSPCTAPLAADPLAVTGVATWPRPGGGATHVAPVASRWCVTRGRRCWDWARTRRAVPSWTSCCPRSPRADADGWRRRPGGRRARSVVGWRRTRPSG